MRAILALGESGYFAFSIKTSSILCARHRQSANVFIIWKAKNLSVFVFETRKLRKKKKKAKPVSDTECLPGEQRVPDGAHVSEGSIRQNQRGNEQRVRGRIGIRSLAAQTPEY